MMETVLNIGLNDASVKGLAEESAATSGSPGTPTGGCCRCSARPCWTCPARCSPTRWTRRRPPRASRSDVDLDVDDLQGAGRATFKTTIREHSGTEFPQHPREQLDLAIRAVFDSWNTDRARLYRRRERIPQDLGTAVNVCTMVFGNLGDTSGTGVAFTRDPASGSPAPTATTWPTRRARTSSPASATRCRLDDLAKLDPASHTQLTRVMRRLETHYRDLCDIEFTIERGKLWMLQTRVGKRTAGRGVPDRRPAGRRAADHHGRGAGPGDRRAAGAADVPAVRPVTAERDLLTKGMAASPGAAVGRVVFDSPTAKAWADRGEQVVLVRKETNPDDLEGMIAADGILTARGGKTTPRRGGRPRHGQDLRLRRRGAGRRRRRQAVTGRRSTVIDEGDLISIDGSTGEVFLGAMPVVPSPVETYIEDGLDAALDGADDETADLVTAVDRLLQPRRQPTPARGAGQRRHRRGRRPGPAPGRPGHRAVPHRAHVPRRPPRR